MSLAQAGSAISLILLGYRQIAMIDSRSGVIFAPFFLINVALTLRCRTQSRFGRYIAASILVSPRSELSGAIALRALVQFALTLGVAAHV